MNINCPNVWPYSMIYIEAFQPARLIWERIKYDHFMFLIFIKFQMVKLCIKQNVGLRLNAAQASCENYSPAALNNIPLMNRPR